MQFIPSLPKKLFLTFGRLNTFCWVCLTFSALNIYGTVILHPAIAMSLNSDFTVTGIETVPKITLSAPNTTTLSLLQIWRSYFIE
ncbi:uncharacterized protein Dvar_47020 [Desulfosarcina variabilis str. Montpellier]